MSMKNKIHITEFDRKRLKGLIEFAEERWDNKVLPYLEDLDGELDRAEVVKPDEIDRALAIIDRALGDCVGEWKRSKAS